MLCGDCNLAVPWLEILDPASPGIDSTIVYCIEVVPLSMEHFLQSLTLGDCARSVMAPLPREVVDGSTFTVKE